MGLIKLFSQYPPPPPQVSKTIKIGLLTNMHILIVVHWTMFKPQGCVHALWERAVLTTQCECFCPIVNASALL